MHDVAVLNDIVFTLDTHLACLTDSGLGAVLDIVGVFDDLGTDEAFLEVGMDDTRTLLSLPAFLVRPCLHLHFSGSDEGL